MIGDRFINLNGNNYVSDMFVKLQQYFLYGFILFPWMTVWLYREIIINGSKWEYGTLMVYVSELLLWGSLFFFILTFITQFKKSNTLIWLTNKKVLFSVFILILPFFLSIFWASDKILALQHSLRVLLVFVLVLLIWFGSKQRYVLWFILLAGVMPALLGIYQFITQSTISSTLFGLSTYMSYMPGSSVVVTAGERWLRAYGHASHPNVFGGLMLMHIIAGWILLQTETAYKRLLQLFIFMGGVALFFSFSRSAWLAALLFTGLSIWYKKDSFKHLYPVAIGVFVVAIIFSQLIVGRVSMQSINEKQSVVERVGAIGEFVAVFSRAPVTGVGAGNYTLALMFLYPDKPIWVYQPVHVVPLLITAEIGVIGVFLILLMLFYLLFIFRSYWRPLVLIYISLLPIILLDHYLYSSYGGLIMFGIMSSYILPIKGLNIRKNLEY